MNKQTYILFKQFLPKQISTNKTKLQPVSFNNTFKKYLTKQLQRNKTFQKQLTNTYQTHLANKNHQHHKQNIYSSNKRTFSNPNKHLSIHLLQMNKIHSSRSSMEFTDSNVWSKMQYKGLNRERQKFTKRNITKDIKSEKLKLTTFDRPNLENLKSNLSTFKRMVRCQSEQRNYKQMMHFDIVHTRKAFLKSNLLNPEEIEKIKHKQQKDQIRLKLLTRIALSKQDLHQGYMKVRQNNQNNPKSQNNDNIHFGCYPSDLTTSKVVFQRKQSLKKNFIDQCRRQKYHNTQMISIKKCKKCQNSSQIPLNITSQIKHKLKKTNNQRKTVRNNTEMFQAKKDWTINDNQAIEPW